MSSRAAILARIASNKPQPVAKPDLLVLEDNNLQQHGSLDQFSAVTKGIGAEVRIISNLSEVNTFIKVEFAANQRVISAIPELLGLAEDSTLLINAMPHELKNVNLAIIRAEFGIAENGALWVTADQMVIRALPFITQHLAIIVNADDIVHDLHAAYLRTSGSDHSFASFIAGPSKTADIEQSLVLGAHGSRSLLIFVLQNPDV